GAQALSEGRARARIEQGARDTPGRRSRTQSVAGITGARVRPADSASGVGGAAPGSRVHGSRGATTTARRHWWSWERVVARTCVPSGVTEFTGAWPPCDRRAL